MAEIFNAKKLLDCVKRTKQAAFEIARLTTEEKNKILIRQAAALLENKYTIIQANKEDLHSAKRSRLSAALVDRLTLDEVRINKMSASLNALVKLTNPVGKVIRQWYAPSGLKISKTRVPIGVILIIYESRPDVTSDCAGLCIKSGNCVILRGGKEAINTNRAIYKVLSRVLDEFSVSSGAINLINTIDRRAVNALLKMDDYIDLVIPRGGESLIRKINRSSMIPVIKHYKGVCHIYVDRHANLIMAENICFNAKMQRPGTCNAMESMLVHEDVAIKFLPDMLKRFTEEGVMIHACPRTLNLIKGARLDKKKIKRAKESDYSTEYLGLILTVKVVKDLPEAISHINHYGSQHSDAIITDNLKVAEEFLKKVDSACVYQNASTRFTDGYQFGMGAEIGISTDRIHARGPMALEELTTYKYIIHGSGQVRT